MHFDDASERASVALRRRFDALPNFWFAVDPFELNMVLALFLPLRYSHWLMTVAFRVGATFRRFSAFSFSPGVLFWRNVSRVERLSNKGSLTE